jgi:DASH complex subunit ASK1
MSRQPAPRGLTLTEELERLEQQITLTLQEIDSNFSKAHRIVTSSILPIVEQYGKHSNDVWESSKFWKQFFEASANVSLSGYEEAALDDQDATNTGLDETTTQLDETPQSERHPHHGHNSEEEDDSYTIESPTQVTGVHSTPKLPPSNGKSRSTQHKPVFSKETNSAFRSPSPRKYTGRNPLAASQSSTGPSTPNAYADNTQDLFSSSPFEAGSAARPTPNPDTVLHRNVLDKNYRIQATPHSQRKQHTTTYHSKPSTPGTATRTTQRQPWDDSPGSSPEISAPQLRSDLFSPAKQRSQPLQQQHHQLQPPTPGISLLTPAKARPSHGAAPASTTRLTSTGRPLSSPPSASNRTSHFFAAADSSDEDDSFVMSPPKTMQFHVPQSRLLQTPAREASRKIVEDLLLTAGADATDEIEGDGAEWEEPSPSVVRKGWDVDDTF